MDMAMPMMVRVAPIQKVMEVLLGFVRSFIFGIVCALCVFVGVCFIIELFLFCNILLISVDVFILV